MEEDELKEIEHLKDFIANEEENKTLEQNDD